MLIRRYIRSLNAGMAPQPMSRLASPVKPQRFRLAKAAFTFIRSSSSVRIGFLRQIDAVLDRLEPPAGAWAFALRIWIATMVALYAAFWLQLGSPSTAAVTVGILAQPTRGQVLSRAVYRCLGTAVGFIASLVFVALFGQERVLMLASVSIWLGLCVFVSNYLEGARSYGAVLSGYTVGNIAVANIDAPQDVFNAGIARAAVIVIGVFSIALVNVAFGSPNALKDVREKLRAARDATQGFVRALLRGEDPGPESTVALLRQAISFQTAITFIVGEFTDGRARAAGARSAVSALLGEAAAARAFAEAAKHADPGYAEALRALILSGIGGVGEASRALELRLQAAMTDASSTPDSVLLLERAAGIVRYELLAKDGSEALDGLHPPRRDVRLPVLRDIRDALRNGFRVAILFAVSGILLILTGWPATSGALFLVALLACLSSQAPTPSAFADAALLAATLAIASSGLVEFVILNDGQGFPLLAIAMAPVTFAACFLTQRRQTAQVATLLLVFFPVMLAPSNPQPYDLYAFIDQGVLLLAAAVLVSVLLRIVLPVTDAQRRRWSIQVARVDLVKALRGEPDSGEERINVDSHRLVQIPLRQRMHGIAYRAALRHGFVLADLDAAAAGARTALNHLAEAPGFHAVVRGAREALAGVDAEALRHAAFALLAAADTAPEPVRRAAAGAVADLAAAAGLVAREGSLLRRLDLAPAS